MANIIWDVYDGMVSRSKEDKGLNGFVTLIVFFYIGLFAAGPIIVLGFILYSLFNNYPLRF